MTEIDVPDRLLPLLGILRRAYPDGVPERDYTALLELLQWRMSERSLATIVAALVGREPMVVAVDSAMRAGLPAGDGAPAPDIWRVRDRLKANGWDEVARGFEKKDVHARISPLPELPDFMVEALDVLRRAYPDGIPGTDYYPLLAALWRDCSQRGLARGWPASSALTPAVTTQPSTMTLAACGKRPPAATRTGPGSICWTTAGYPNCRSTMTGLPRARNDPATGVPHVGLAGAGAAGAQIE